MEREFKIPNSNFHTPYIDLNKYEIKKEAVVEIPESVARRYELIAIDKKADYLLVAMADPLNFFALDDIKMFTDLNIQVVATSREDIIEKIDYFYTEEATQEILREFTAPYLNIRDEEVKEREENKRNLEISTAPVVKLINTIIEKGVEMRASDIHIEPLENLIRIRFRINGDLHEIMTLSYDYLSPIITRIKIMGKMDIAEKRLPQDGRLEVEINENPIDIRISTIPTVNGEKAVLRILNRKRFMLSKDELGFTDRNMELFNQILRQPYGMILVTGPAGSGKTTTLYAILQDQEKSNKNILTIEDPVEYKIPGVNQVQINLKAGLDFATGLRAVLRQDPNTIMIGEIRDPETAYIASRAATSGHLVLSTLHTNDSVSAIIRLIDMGVEPYIVSAAVIGVISQRLIKELCPYCKVAKEASYSEKILLKLDTNKKLIVYKPKGCNKCTNGFIGRRGIHEILIINENIRGLISQGAHVDKIRYRAREEGMTSLFENVSYLVKKGITSIEEALKVVYTLN